LPVTVVTASSPNAPSPTRAEPTAPTIGLGDRARALYDDTPLAELVVEERLRLRVQRRVDRDDVALGHHLLGALVVGEAELSLHLVRRR
jgi:hypothetical protein